MLSSALYIFFHISMRILISNPFREKYNYYTLCHIGAQHTCTIHLSRQCHSILYNFKLEFDTPNGLLCVVRAPTSTTQVILYTYDARAMQMFTPINVCTF